MSADTKRFKSANTNTETDISAKILVDTDTETNNFHSLVLKLFHFFKNSFTNPNLDPMPPPLKFAILNKNFCFFYKHKIQL